MNRQPESSGKFVDERCGADHREAVVRHNQHATTWGAGFDQRADDGLLGSQRQHDDVALQILAVQHGGDIDVAEAGVVAHA